MATRYIALHPKFKALSNIYCISGTYGGYDGPNNLYTQINPDTYNSNIIKINTSSDLKLCINEVTEVITNFNKIHNLPIILIGWSQGGYTIINVIKDLVATPIYKKIKLAIIISSRPENTDFISKMDNIKKVIICGNKDTERRINGSRELYNKASEPKEFIEIKNGTHNFELEECFTELYYNVNKILLTETYKFL
jgi:hypothetical protein